MKCKIMVGVAQRLGLASLIVTFISFATRKITAENKQSHEII